jgi:putative ABC transport system permease protein
VRPDMLLQGLLLAVVAALLAGLYPALRMAGASPAEALRDE